MLKLSEQEIAVHRERILAAAMRVFEQHGIAQASMRRIAKEAGVTTGAIYPHFENKEDAYAQLLHQSLDRLYAAVQTAGGDDRDPAGRLRASAFAFLDYYESRLFEYELGLNTFQGLARNGLGKQRDRELNASLMRVSDVWAARIRELAPHLNAERIRAERSGLYVHLAGLITLMATGRLRPINGQTRPLLDEYLNNLIRRIAS